MKDLRYNAFNQIHKGLRTMLYDTAITLQHTDFANPEHAKPAFRKVELVVWLFDSHAHSEDSLVFPLIKNVAPEIVADFEAQHQTDEKLSKALKEIMNTYEQALYPVEQVECGVLLLRAFNEFIAFNLQHMNKEEQVINDLLLDNYTIEELGAMEKKIVGNIPPDKNEHYNLWMMRGINNAELLMWLRKVKMGAPKDVYNGLCNLAIRELKADRWKEISSALTAEPELN